VWIDVVKLILLHYRRNTRLYVSYRLAFTVLLVTETRRFGYWPLLSFVTGIINLLSCAPSDAFNIYLWVLVRTWIWELRFAWRRMSLYKVVLGSFIFWNNNTVWDVTPCSSVKVRQSFEVIYCFHSNTLVRKNIYPKGWWTSNGPHYVTYQKTVIFIVTTVRGPHMQHFISTSISSYEGKFGTSNWRCGCKGLFHNTISFCPYRQLSSVMHLDGS
jgi:hypothetical protein